MKKNTRLFRTMKAIICLTVLISSITCTAFASGENQENSYGVYQYSGTQSTYFDLDNYDPQVSVLRMSCRQGSLKVGNGSCCTFILNEPIEDCEYLWIPVMIRGAERSCNYDNLSWYSLFHDAKTGDWIYTNFFSFKNGEYRDAILDLRGEDSITVDAFTVVPLFSDNYGSFQIQYKLTAIIGIRSEHWANYFAEQLAAYSRKGPSAADLDAINANIRYPRLNSFYLNYYINTSVVQEACFAFLDPNSGDVLNKNNYFVVYQGDRVIILAESQGYACVIFPDLGKAGWINCDYLADY